MHFEVLVEDQSGKKVLDILVPRIIDLRRHSFKAYAYKGIGRIPKNIQAASEGRMLLDQLPRLLKGYGKTFAAYPPEYPATLIVVCDLDDRSLKAFKNELEQLLAGCAPQPAARFCIAIEEGEAWLLGDPAAVKKAFPQAKAGILSAYVNDSICGTWECLANAVYRGGANQLAAQGYQAVGREKSQWAEQICPHMDVDANNSPSFRYFRTTLRQLAGMAV